MNRTITIDLNGARVALHVEETATLLDVLRSELGVTSPRFGCGAGECGTCAVLIDGEDRAACMVEVGNVDGRRVTTVEGNRHAGGAAPDPGCAARKTGGAVRLLPVGTDRRRQSTARS